MRTHRHSSQPLKIGPGVAVNRPGRGDDILFEICRCVSAASDHSRRDREVTECHRRRQSGRSATCIAPMNWESPLHGGGACTHCQQEYQQSKNLRALAE